jgi:DNA replication protein DnaC
MTRSLKRSFSLPRMLNSEFEQVEQMAKKAGHPLSTCPTCLARLIEVDEDNYGWESGTYRFRGEEHECDCDVQRKLYRHYLLANIPEEYMRLNWADYSGDPEVLEPVATYLEKWRYFRGVGMGMSFASENLGVGKTFAATHVGKELLKQGVRVYFEPFLEVIRVYTRDDAQAKDDLFRNTQVLILDEVVPPRGNQGEWFAAEFERLVRHRTSHHLPTIITTNMEPNELHATFPRVYSLLEAKQWSVVLRGEDARRQIIADENLELALNEEVRPIT